MRIYLAGPINGCSDAECKDWRAAAKSLHADCLDPMDRDYRGKEDQSVREIVEGDKADIDNCDAVLVMYEKPSIGTSMEILYAWQKQKPVAILNATRQRLSPWLIYHSQAQYFEIAAAIEYLKTAKWVA